MKLSIETLSPVKRALSIEIESSVVGREFDAAYSELGRRAKVPGFRPGKIPLPVLEKRFQRRNQRSWKPLRHCCPARQHSALTPIQARSQRPLPQATLLPHPANRYSRSFGAEANESGQAAGLCSAMRKSGVS